MKCPFCAHLDDKVVDSREARTGDLIRRRLNILADQSGHERRTGQCGLQTRGGTERFERCLREGSVGFRMSKKKDGFHGLQ